MSATEPKALVKNAGDREQVKNAGERAKLNQEQADADAVAVMDTPAGRRFVWGLLAAAGTDNSSFTENSLRMAFLEGNRNQGLQLRAHLKRACPQLYATMETEIRKREVL